MIGTKFSGQVSPPITLSMLTGAVHGLARALFTIFGLALLLEGVALLTPQLLQIIVDQVMADEDRNLLTVICMGAIALIIIQTLVSALRTWTVVWMSTSFNVKWSGKVFRHLLRLPQAYFLKRHLGDVVSRFGAIDTIQHTLTTQFVEVVLDGVMAVATLSVMFMYDLRMTVITVVALLLYGVVRICYFKVYRESNLNLIVTGARQQSQFIESLRGVQTVKIFNQVSEQCARYMNATVDALNTSIAVQRLNLWFGSLNSLVLGAQKILVMWLGAWLALRGGFTAGMLMAFISYADQFTGRAVSLIDYFIQFRLLRLQGERLADIVLSEPEPYSEGVYVGPRPSSTIKFENVGFRYAAGDPWIVRECSFEITEGESVAIVGPSGCGKSTLVRLMLGLVDPTEGKISIGGVDLKHLGKRAYREMIGCVMQEDSLFAGSISDNISFCDKNEDHEHVMNCAQFAQLHDDIVSMPMGYHTLVGDMGSVLSGGQKQRLLIARALYKNPSILVLDEATSHLDIIREKLISLHLASVGMTKVVIAHRNETIALVDRVLRLSDGRVTQASEHSCVPADALG